MKVVPGYRNIYNKNKILGLEFFDFLILIFVYLLVFLLSRNLLLNLPLIFAAYLILRLYKKGKPPHFTASFIRFLATPRSYPMARESQKEVFS